METMEPKCSNCLRKVSEASKTYYEIWEKKKEDWGLGRKEAIFCENCWKEQEEKNYRNYPLDTDQVKRRITENEIIETSSNSWESKGDWIYYDQNKGWTKEKLTSVPSENKPTGKENGKSSEWIIGIFVTVVLIVLLLLLFIYGKNRKNRPKKKG